MAKLVECVPNISEGRNQEIIEACVNEVRNTAGVKLVDYSSDPDHNRSVITFVGTPQEVKEAAYALTKKAASLIDLTKHSGTHKRMGAVDVIPFIPLGETTMEECVQISEELGERIGSELGIPVYLYANSAKRKQCAKLPTIRKGEFEGFDEKIKQSKWEPDFGPTEKHPTFGCVAVGAREFLVAFNVYLDTTDMHVANSIANSIRESGGGLQHLQAMGMFIEEKSMVQISMNNLHFKKLPLYRLIEVIRMEASRWGVSIRETELIGLIPLQAILDSFSYYTQLPSLSADQIIDMKIHND
ncbi:MAG: glutamate formimidoyltransferase [Caldisericia bacterium]|nr:glutamate formimidoyltransferase [Caldisericia bacterium]MDD4613983.1 glutamate formimidoyltransferase [Caldisericia bacterium]